MTVPEFKQRTFEDFIRVRDEMGEGTGVGNLMSTYGLSQEQADKVLRQFSAEGQFRYFGSEQKDGEKTGYRLS